LRKPWAHAAIFVGFLYAIVGILFAVPVTHANVWRLAAWLVSALAFAAHLAYERFRLHTSPRSAALHIAASVALGAFGLAVGANIHSVSIESTTQHRQLLILALGIWPVMTALPAYLVALGISSVLARAFRSVEAEQRDGVRPN
jgi:hypothetical protein